MQTIKSYNLNKVLFNRGWQLLQTRPLTNHIADQHLKVVFAYNIINDEYIVCLYNEENGGLYEGDYIKDFWIAVERYNNKI